MKDVVSTPRILDEGEIDGRYFYDMEFVRGPDGTSYLMRASYEEVTLFTDRLCTYLEEASAGRRWWSPCSRACSSAVCQGL